ncbi:hypothetical protein ACFQH8_14115 [Halomicroarcula sp. GCM10025710]
MGEWLVYQVRELAPDEHDCDQPSVRETAVTNGHVREHREGGDDEMLMREHYA